jgi:predicted esterase
MLRHISLLFIFLVGCENAQVSIGDTPQTPNENSGSTTPVTEEPVPFSCPVTTPIVQGSNSHWKIGNIDRQFYIDLPNVDPKTPIFVIFSFYGVGDSINNWRRYFSPNPDQDPTFPFAHVTFEDTTMSPYSAPQGLVWDMFESTANDDNREAKLFEAVLGCLQQKFKIHSKGIYVVGFSGGAIMADLFHSRYPHYIGAVVAESGAWFNDPQEKALLHPPVSVDINWTPLEDATGTVFLTHGGRNDTFGTPLTGQIISFENANKLAVPFLTAHGRTVVDCPHASGHQPHPKLTQELIVTFLRAHAADKPSPYLTSGLPASLQQIGCTLETL